MEFRNQIVDSWQHTKLVIVIVSIEHDKPVVSALNDRLSKNDNISVVTTITSKLSLVKESIRHLSGVNNAAVVPLISRQSCSDQSFISYCRLLMDGIGGVVVGVRLYGVRIEDQPQWLRIIHGVSISNPKYDDQQTSDCANHLRQLIISEINKRIAVDLMPRTANLFTLTVNIVVPVGHDLDKRVSALMAEVKKQLQDPWTSIRRCLLQLFKVVNIRVVDPAERDGLLLEIIPADRKHLDVLRKYCDNGKMEAMFSNCFKSLKTTMELEFSFSIDYLDGNLAEDEEIRSRSGQQVDSLLSGSSGLNEAVLRWKRSSALGRIAKEIVSENSKYQPNDLFTQLEKNKGKVLARDVEDDEGHNLLHMVVLSGRSEFLEVIFYGGIWDELRSETIDLVKDGRYGGHTGRGLAEKLLYRDMGPSVLAELEYFDELWMTMPLLQRACLLAKPEHVRWICATAPPAGDQLHSAVRYACASGRVDLVEQLVARGADPTAENGRRENGLILAAKFSRTSMVRHLLAGFRFPKDPEDRRKNRAVDYPAINGDSETMEAFRDGGMPPDAITLAKAAKYARIRIAERLITGYGIQLSGRDSDGRTPLLNAAANGTAKLVELLLDRGADLLDVDEARRNCLHLAAEGGHLEACKLLVAAARRRRLLAELMDEKDLYNESAYCTLVRGRDRGRPVWHYALVQRTLEHQFELAKQTGQVDVKQFAEIKHSGFGRLPDEDARKRIDDEMAASSKVKERLPDLTPLALATYLGNDQVACLLIDEGARLDVTDCFGNTLLHLAAIRGNRTLIQKLPIGVKDVDKKNDAGQSPIDVAELNDHNYVRMYFEGLKQMKYAETITKFIEESKNTFHEDRLLSLRSTGQDTRLYVIEKVRGLKVVINQLLIEMGSGPVLEETSYGHSRKRQEFAGLHPLFKT